MKKKRFLLFILFVIVGISFYLVPFHPVSSTKIPVVFNTDSYHPLIKCEILGKTYVLLVDSGANNSLYLTKNIFDHIQKKQTNKIVKSYDVRGKLYNWQVYSVSGIKIGSIHLPEYEIVEESIDFHQNTYLWSPTRRMENCDRHGRLGWHFFQDYCTQFDFPNCSIFIAKSMDDLKKDEVLKTENYIAVPFTIEDGVIVISIETDLGKQRVILDTGATYCTLKKAKIDPNAIKQSPSGKAYFPSSKLMIDGYDFGDWRFAVTEITDLIHADGFIGVDFFLEHAVCFDFPNKIAYFKKPEGCIATQWKRLKFHLTQFYLRNFSDLPKVEDL